MSETTYGRRLRVLLEHLHLSPAEFAARTSLTEGYVSKILSGSLGKSGDLPKLHHKAQTAFGVSDIYWTSRSDISPQQAQNPQPSRGLGGGAYMGRMTGPQSFGHGADVRDALAALAAERDDDPGVIKALLRTSPPSDADALWWFRRYLELSDAAKR